MKIIRHPFHASIVPQEQSEPTDALWHCVIRRDGSAEILSSHDARKKEDATCMALLELARLQRSRRPETACRAS
jgi:hypothetical protein